MTQTHTLADYINEYVGTKEEALAYLKEVHTENEYEAEEGLDFDAWVESIDDMCEDYSLCVNACWHVVTGETNSIINCAIEYGIDEEEM